MTKPFQPLLADAVEFQHVDYSNLWLSPKYDGIRALVIDGKVVSRNLKPIRNAHVQHLFGRPEFEGYDGELIVGEPTAKDCYNVTESGVMKAKGEPDVRFFVFDTITNPLDEYHLRYNRIDPNKPRIVKVPQFPVENHQHLLDIEQEILELGYEGVMGRKIHGPNSFYKFGRATAKQGNLWKLKRFTDAEAEIIGVEEEMQNNNEAVTNALGHTERSAHKDNKTGKGRLGALICKTAEGTQFNIGTGFDHATRTKLWAERADLPGRFVKFKYFEIGVKAAPRFPVFKGFRDPIDMPA